MALNANDRQRDIVQQLGLHGEVSIAELSVRLGVSEMTVRRDLTQLASEGLLVRTHGGAIPATSSFEPPFALRSRTNPEAKRAIAECVASQVRDGQTVIVDGGSTGVAIAEALAGRAITACALNLTVGQTLNDAGGTRVLIPGGEIRPGEASLVGPEAQAFFGQMRFDLYLMSVSAASVEAGFTEWNREDAAVKRAALAAARRTVVAMDAAKFGKEAFARICGLEDVSQLVTDQEASAELQTAARRHGVELVTPAA